MIIHYVDGLCGSAKTYAAVRHAHRLARLGKKVLICQPSIFLINQTVSDFASLTPEVRFRAIHGETSKHVIADIINHAKHTAWDGELLMSQPWTAYLLDDQYTNLRRARLNGIDREAQAAGIRTSQASPNLDKWKADWKEVMSQ